MRVIVRPCQCEAEAALVVHLCATNFPEEVRSQGLSALQYVELEGGDLARSKACWDGVGLAWEGETLLGAVVLTFAHEKDESISWLEYSQRVGCWATALSLMYDSVLEERLQPQECLVDFIAVAPEARGKGVGAQLMAWAEAAALAVLRTKANEAVAAHGVQMTLWVADDNAVACRLYDRCGYAITKRTNQGTCQCIMSRVLQHFLGHPVWCKMSKRLPAAEKGPTVAPQPVVIPLSITAGEAAAAAAAAQFENVPLDDASDARVRQASRRVTAPPALQQQARQGEGGGCSVPPGALKRKLSMGLCKLGSAMGIGGLPTAAATGTAPEQCNAAGEQMLALQERDCLPTLPKCSSSSSSGSREAHAVHLYAATHSEELPQAVPAGVAHTHHGPHWRPAAETAEQPQQHQLMAEEAGVEVVALPELSAASFTSVGCQQASTNAAEHGSSLAEAVAPGGGSSLGEGGEPALVARVARALSAQAATSPAAAAGVLLTAISGREAARAELPAANDKQTGRQAVVHSQKHAPQHDFSQQPVSHLLQRGTTKQ